MQRGSFDTSRWPRRLTVALTVSLVMHALVFVVPTRPPPLPTIDLAVNHAVELGIEEARPGAEAPPTAPPSPPELPPEPPPAAPPPPPHHAPRARAPEPAPSPAALPELDTRLTPPSLLLVREDAGSDAAEDTALALADAGSDGGDESALAANDAVDAADESAMASADAGDDATDESALASADADTDAGAGMPTLASAAGGLAAAVPAGSVVTLLLRMDRIRDNPQAPRVSALLQSIRDWRLVLDGTELDPVRDFNTVLLASADPFGTPDDPPDILALVRTRTPRGFLRASVEQMAGARAASLPPTYDDAGVRSDDALRDHFTRADAGALAPPTQRIWRRQGGAEVATIDRYMGPHEVVLLGDDLAAIAPRARVPQLLAVLAARGRSALAPGDDGRLVMLLQADGVRNLLALPGRATFIPTRADVAISATEDGGAPDGGVELIAVLPYEDDAQAARVAPIVSAFAMDVTDTIDRSAATLQGRLAAASGAVHFDRLRSAVQAIHVRAEGSSLRVEARLSSDEVAELLNVQRLSQLFR